MISLRGVLEYEGIPYLDSAAASWLRKDVVVRDVRHAGEKTCACGQTQKGIRRIRFENGRRLGLVERSLAACDVTSGSTRKLSKHFLTRGSFVRIWVSISTFVNAPSRGAALFVAHAPSTSSRPVVAPTGQGRYKRMLINVTPCEGRSGLRYHRHEAEENAACGPHWQGTFHSHQRSLISPNRRERCG